MNSLADELDLKSFRRPVDAPRLHHLAPSRVVAGTFKDQSLAQAKAEAIRKFQPAWNAHVLQPKVGADQWAVVVGGYLPYPEAKRLKASIVGAKLTNDAFLTSAPWP